MNFDFDIFNNNIRKLMDDNNLSLTRFAEQIGFSRPAVSKWLYRQIYPSVQAIVSICNNFDVTADWLLFGKEK